MTNIDSYIQYLKLKVKLHTLLLFWFVWSLSALSSFVVDLWCLQFVGSVSKWELILFELGIGSSVGMIVSTVLSGSIAIWDGINYYWKSLEISGLPGNIWMSLVYGFASLPGFYFWSGAYICLTSGGFSGAIAGIGCAIISID